MKAIKVSEIANIVEGKLYGDGDRIVSSVVIDSRKVQKDSMLPTKYTPKFKANEMI